MRKPIENYFQFTRNERIGIFILIFLSFLIWLAFPIYTHFFVDETKTDFTEFKKEIALLEITIKEKEKKNKKSYKNYNNYSKSDYSKNYEPKKKTVITPFAFNPNTISEADMLVMGLPKNAINNLVKFRNKGAKFYKKADFKKVYGIDDDIYATVEQFIQLPVNSTKKIKTENYPELKEVKPAINPFPFDPNNITKNGMERLGLSDKVATTIENFRNKGGSFRKAEDLSKIYGLSEEDFNKLYPFIEIKPKVETYASNTKSEFTSKGSNFKPKEKKVVQPIDINKATREEWTTIKGIGPGFSKMIISYREKLGGFYKIDQVSETYGLPDSTFQSIKPFLLIDEVNEKIDLNTVTIDGLKAHPYLNYKQAKAVVNYRHNHGDFATVEDIVKVRVFSVEDVERIAPYLRIGE